MRQLPTVSMDERPGFAACLASGYDTVKETFKVAVPDDLYERLAEAKEAAQQYRRSHKKDRWPMKFGGVEVMVSYLGVKGATYFCQHPNFEIHVRTNSEAPISIRYNSAGLWQFGVEALREQARKIILAECRPICAFDEIGDEESWINLNEIHVAYDFYSPEMTEHMHDFNILRNIVCNSKVKKDIKWKIGCNAYSRGDHLETITIGKKNSLEVQIYDKGQEIRDQSGKDWMVSLWQQEGYHPPTEGRIEHVWRVELRFAKDYLDQRGIKSVEGFSKDISTLIGEALHSRRLTISTGDSNRSRWPMHPIWCAVYRESGSASEMLPLGKQLTMAGQEFVDTMVSQIAGSVRSTVVAKIGGYDAIDAKHLLERVLGELEDDEDHFIKVMRAENRYKNIGDAR